MQLPQTTPGYGSEINIRQELFLIDTLDAVTLIWRLRWFNSIDAGRSVPVGFNYSNLSSHHLINYWRYSQAHQSNLFYSFDFSCKKNTKYEYFKHRAR